VNNVDKNKKIIIFGAGVYGKQALSYFGPEQVSFFADNNADLAGNKVESIPVISFDQLKEIYRDYQIVVSMDISKSLIVSAQLEEAGIREYTLFLKILSENKGGQATAANSKISKETCAKTGKNVLMITYEFPPLAGSGVFRSLKFAKYLPRFGWNPVVFAADRPRADWDYADQSLLEEIPDSVNVIRITDPVSSLQETSILEKKDFLLPFLHEVLQNDPEAEAIFSSFLQSRTGTAEMLTFPCPALMWAYQVLQYIKTNLNIQQFQAVYTSTTPYSDHLVGYYLKKTYGLPWLADYRDPWSGNPLTPLDLTKPRGKLLSCLEAIFLKKADCNITVNEELIQDYVDRFGLASEKIVCITNGYDEDDYTGLEPAVEDENLFIINYCGLQYGGQRIDAVLESLRELANEKKIDPELVRLRITGESKQSDTKEAAREFGLESIILETGYVTHKEAIQSNLNANMLLLLMTGTGETLKTAGASKLYDYLRSGWPILAFGAKDGVIDRTLRETRHGEAFRSTQIPEIKAMILREYQKWQSGQAVPLLPSPEIERFERKHLTGKLVELLEAVRRC